MKAFATILFMVFCTLVSGQKQVIHQQQIWYKYYLKIPIGDQWQIRQELDDRNYTDPARQSQFLTRTHFQRNLGKGWSTALGFAYFVHSLPQDPEIQDYYNQSELRPSFEVANLNKLSEKFHLHHRYWTEFRFFQQPDHTYLYNNIRVRYKIELGYELSEKFSFLVYDELHINLGSKITYNVFDQNRIGASIMYSPVKNIGFELMYINWFQQTTNGETFYDRNIIRFALHQTLPIFKGQRGEKEELITE